MAGEYASQVEPNVDNVDFSARMIDQFFRRWFWYVLPILLLGVVGLRAAGNVTGNYVSKGTLSASANPLVATPKVSGSSIGQFEPPATGIARLINEQLRSDSFVKNVADRAGLTGALASQVITPDIIRQQIAASAEGENLLTVRASWSNPDTAYKLVDATINSYLDLIAQTVAVDSVQAIQFWTDVQKAAQTRADAAETDLRTYAATLPDLRPGEQRTTDQELTLTRLNKALDDALKSVSDAQASIDTAKLNVQQSKSEAGRQVREVDPPTRPSLPQPTKFKQLLTMVMFGLMGMVISLMAVAVTTAADHSIRSLAQLRLASGTDATASVQRSRELKGAARTRRAASQTEAA
jgi:hypothetical protein